MRSKPLVLSLLLALSLSAFALPLMQGPAVEKTVDLKIEKADVRETLRKVFQQFDKAYTISPEIQGSVNADFRNLVLDDALSVILRQVGGVIRVEAGIYQVIPRSDLSSTVILDGPIPGARASLNPEPPKAAAVVTQDEKFVYVLEDGNLTKVDKEAMRVVATVRVTPRKIRVQY